MRKPNDRRWKLFRINADNLQTLLNFRVLIQSHTRSISVTTPEIAKLPIGSVIDALTCKFELPGTLLLLVYNPDFDVVPEGQEVPLDPSSVTASQYSFQIPLSLFGMEAKLEKLVAYLADESEFNWTHSHTDRTTADAILSEMVRQNIIGHRGHPLGGHIWIVNGKEFGRTET